MAKIDDEQINKLVYFVERIEYWENILNVKLGTDFDWNDVDKYFTTKYADELKMPEIIAKILGSNGNK